MSLINMAALVKDAVASVDQADRTSYSNIVSQLLRVFPNELQQKSQVPGSQVPGSQVWLTSTVGMKESSVQKSLWVYQAARRRKIPQQTDRENWGQQ